MPGLSDERRFRSVRTRPIRSNNSVRRTYDLLRPQLPALGPDALLSERDLVNTFSASRGTVRHVLQLLAEEGVVTRGPKVGTTVHASTVIPVSELTPLDQWGSRGPVTGRLLESKVIPAFPAVRHRLQLPEESSVAMIEWLLIDDNTPLALFVSYLALSPEQASLLGKEGLSVIDFLEKYLGVSVVKSDTIFCAVASDRQTAALLGTRQGGPILLIEDLLRDGGDRPWAICQIRCRGDRVLFSAKARRLSAKARRRRPRSA